jgi:putative aldouronate transport system substrate-binding protein
MMKRSITLLALVVSLMMIVATSGCTTSSPPTAAPAASGSASAASGTPAPKPEAVKLVWYCMLGNPQRDQDMVFAKFSEYVKEQINADVEIKVLDWGGYTQKLQAVAASGEEYDLAWVSNWNQPLYADLANKGALVALDDLLPQYAPQTLAFMNQNIWDGMRIDGKIYGVTCYQIMTTQMGLWVRKDIADKYNFDPKSLTTAKDLEPFYDAVLAGEPDLVPIAANYTYIWHFGRGDKGPWPYKGTRVQLQANICSGMSVFSDDPTVVEDEYDSSTTAGQITDAMINLAHEWYTKKYVRSDMLTITDMNAEIKTGRYVSGFHMLKPGGDVEFKDKNGFEIYDIPLEEPQLGNGQPTVLAVSATSKNPERAVQLIELLNTDKYLYNLICYGIEGTHYVKTGENRISRVENNGYQPSINWALGNTFLAYLLPGQPDDLNEQTKKLNDTGKPKFLSGWTFNDEKVKNEATACAALWTEYGNPLLAGVLDPATKYPEFKKKLKDAGLDAIQAEVRAQYDAYLADHK